MPQHRHNRGRAVVGPLSGTLYIPYYSLEINPIYYLQKNINSISGAFSNISNDNYIISTQSSTSLNFPDECIDYIFLDPPFGSNLMYSELNFLTEAWLEVFTNNNDEAIVNSTQRKSLSSYQDIIEKCFDEYYRLLKPGRWMTVEFHNSQNSVWNAIQEAILYAGFMIADVRTLDKVKGTTKQLTYTNTAKQDLIISAYKPETNFVMEFQVDGGSLEGAWAFIRQHLEQLPIPSILENGLIESLAERL